MEDIVIVSAVRTAVGKFGGSLAKIPATELGAIVIKEALARGLADGGYAPPKRRTVKVPGSTGRAAIELFLYQMREGGMATEHDVVVGKKLAHVLTGGDVPWGTVRTEQDLLDLEREAFLSLAGTPASQARMQHMLQTGKPLRN